MRITENPAPEGEPGQGFISDLSNQFPHEQFFPT